LWDGGFAGWPGVGKVGLGPSRRAVAPAGRAPLFYVHLGQKVSRHLHFTPPRTKQRRICPA